MPGRSKLAPQRLFDAINGVVEEVPHRMVVAAQTPYVAAIVVAINCADAPNGLLVKIGDLVAVFDLELAGVAALRPPLVHVVATPAVGSIEARDYDFVSFRLVLPPILVGTFLPCGLKPPEGVNLLFHVLLPAARILHMAVKTDHVLVVALALDGVDLAQAMVQGVVHHPASRLLRTLQGGPTDW